MNWKDKYNQVISEKYKEITRKIDDGYTCIFYAPSISPEFTPYILDILRNYFSYLKPFYPYNRAVYIHPDLGCVDFYGVVYMPDPAIFAVVICQIIVPPYSQIDGKIQEFLGYRSHHKLIERLKTPWDNRATRKDEYVKAILNKKNL